MVIRHMNPDQIGMYLCHGQDEDRNFFDAYFYLHKGGKLKVSVNIQ